MTSKDKLALLSILDTIDEMQSYCQKEECTDFESFSDNQMLKRATAMCMISISEAIIKLSDEFKNENTEIDTNQFRTVRNIAAHNYGAINFSKIWDVLNIDIQKLKSQLEKVLENVMFE